VHFFQPFRSLSNLGTSILLNSSSILSLASQVPRSRSFKTRAHNNCSCHVSFSQCQFLQLTAAICLLWLNPTFWTITSSSTLALRLAPHWSDLSSNSALRRIKYPYWQNYYSSNFSPCLVFKCFKIALSQNQIIQTLYPLCSEFNELSKYKVCFNFWTI
jgi:hypothetical protein